MKKSPLKRKGKTPLKKAKDKANAAFSKYIRTKYLNKDGTLTCYTCENKGNPKYMHAGHGIGGRNNAILYEEKLVKPQCIGCNVFGGGKYSIFAEKLIDEMGEKEYVKLVKQSNQIVQYKTHDFEEIEQQYIRKLEGLHE